MPEREKRQERREERPLSRAGKGESMILSVPFILSNYEDAENPWPALQSCLAEASRALSACRCPSLTGLCRQVSSPVSPLILVLTSLMLPHFKRTRKIIPKEVA